MSIDNLFDGIEEQLQYADMPEVFNAKVISINRGTKKGEYSGSPVLLIKVEAKEVFNKPFEMQYRIPKKLTGRGQFDILKQSLERMNVQLSDLVGKIVKFERIELAMGNPRHFPTEIIQ